MDGIVGLGPKRKQKLLTTFKNLKAIEEASVQEVAEADIPYEVAERVKTTLSGPIQENENWESLKDNVPLLEGKK